MAEMPDMEFEQLKSWMAATGFLLPTNKEELECFVRLYKAELAAAKEDAKGAVDVDRILAGKTRTVVLNIEPVSDNSVEDLTPLRMVARNGKPVPDHILKKMKNNQLGKKGENE